MSVNCKKPAYGRQFHRHETIFLYVLPLNVAILYNISLHVNLKLCRRLCTPEKKGKMATKEITIWLPKFWD